MLFSWKSSRNSVFDIVHLVIVQHLTAVTSQPQFFGHSGKISYHFTVQKLVSEVDCRISETNVRIYMLNVH